MIKKGLTVEYLSGLVISLKTEGRFHLDQIFDFDCSSGSSLMQMVMNQDTKCKLPMTQEYSGFVQLTVLLWILHPITPFLNFLQATANLNPLIGWMSVSFIGTMKGQQPTIQPSRF